MTCIGMGVRIDMSNVHRRCHYFITISIVIACCRGAGRAWSDASFHRVTASDVRVLASPSRSPAHDAPGWTSAGGRESRTDARAGWTRGRPGGRDGRGLPHSGSWVGVKHLPSVITLSIPSLIICTNRKFHADTDCSLYVSYLYHLTSWRDGDADTTLSARKRERKRREKKAKGRRRGERTGRWETT